MKAAKQVSVFWFRRDLRLDDNVGLSHALTSGIPVLPLFIWDEEILDDLPKDDARVSFTFDCLKDLHTGLKTFGSSLLIKKGKVLEVWKELLSKYHIKEVYFNKDYEPYSIKRDRAVLKILNANNAIVHTFKDQVIFEEMEVVKSDGTPYTVFTPYKNKWLKVLDTIHIESLPLSDMLGFNFLKIKLVFPNLHSFGFVKSKQKVNSYDLSNISDYHKYRDYPALDKTSWLSPHLRYGTVSIRKIVVMAKATNTLFLSELIWREFFMQILFHFPAVVNNNFKSKYDAVQWRDDPSDFSKWCEGNTGYPMVDAGMRQLNETGYMHNRVRMVVAGFLCKHLLIHWQLGEAYFAQKLLDYELSSNNGNWQWAAGTGCDAAPYFRIFNPAEQLRKYDGHFKYVRKWVPEFNHLAYSKPMVDHKEARERCLNVFKRAL